MSIRVVMPRFHLHLKYIIFKVHNRSRVMCTINWIVVRREMWSIRKGVPRIDDGVLKMKNA